MKVSEMIEWLKTQDQNAIVQVSVGSVYYETFKDKHAEYYPEDDRPAILLVGGDVSE